MTRKALLLALLASTALSLTGLPAAAQGACLSDRDIQNAWASGQILPFERIKASLPPGAKVVGKFEVCDQGGQFRYLVPVLINGSDARTISLNAVTGQP